MSDERRKAGVCPWVVALLIALPVLYVVSFGPACWLTDWLDRESDWKGFLLVAYRPLLVSVARSPLQVQKILLLYGDPGHNVGTAYYLFICSVVERDSPVSSVK